MSTVTVSLGNAVNSFGFGVVLPFEIVYLHQIRHFGLTTSGLVLSTVTGTAALVNPAVGALLDRIAPRTVVALANLLSAVGYAGLAFVHRPWQAFACSVAAGIGFGASQSAGAPLTMSFLTHEQRPTAFAVFEQVNLMVDGNDATVMQGRFKVAKWFKSKK